ncbi:hypothetical protein EPN42_04510 [bacterium]|nr:MAG: hypothetical protein EPN42_04510 [bacterium]
MNTIVIALSKSQATKFSSTEPYVVISIADVGSRFPYIHPRPAFMGRIGVRFDDVDQYNPHPLDIGLMAMQESHAQRIATYVARAWGTVATIVVHCHAGLSRSTGVAAAIREHYGLDCADLYEAPRIPNGHCKALVLRALSTTT